MNAVKAEIQTYCGYSFDLIVDKEEFEQELKNAELGNTTSVKIFDSNGFKTFLEYKYIANIKYSEIKGRG